MLGIIFVLECVYLLLAHKALVKVKNNFGWTPLAEAISYGDRQISKFHLNIKNVIITYSQLSLNGHLCKTDTSLKRTLGVSPCCSNSSIIYLQPNSS